MKKIISLIITCALVLAIGAGCCEKNEIEAPGEEAVSTGEVVHALITMESGDGIILELYPEIAPITVNNFVKLVNDDFYNGLTFHRIIEGFMIQGGDPEGTGMGGPGYEIKGEFEANGVKNSISHTRGAISMGRKSYGYDTAGSQFFIVHQDSTYLDGQYAAFGRVIAGMDTVDKIASVATDESDYPLQPQVIKTIEIVNLTQLMEEATKEAE